MKQRTASFSVQMDMILGKGLKFTKYCNRIAVNEPTTGGCLMFFKEIDLLKNELDSFRPLTLK